jgi:SAM-dependent methyltransferase
MSDPADPGAPRLYDDLAPWWPLISPVGEYAEEAAYFARLLLGRVGRGSRVLELGSGGGHNALHLRRDFAHTLVDLSPSMVAVSRALNPDCEHHVGDLRDVRLGRTFDAVFVHDAVDYLRTEADLRRAFATIAAHCRPGGTALVVPDHTTETFSPGTEHGGSDGDDGRAARYLDWLWDPDPADNEVRSEFVFVLREPGGQVRVVHDVHRFGLFPRALWVDVFDGAGFDVEVVEEETTDGHPPRTVFLGRRRPPARAPGVEG